MKVDEGIYVA